MAGGHRPPWNIRRTLTYVVCSRAKAWTSNPGRARGKRPAANVSARNRDGSAVGGHSAVTEREEGPMAGSVNKVILIGNLGKDPEIRRTQDGRPIANLRVATTETWRDKASGERREKTEWHSVVIFNEGLCRVAEQYLKKGAKVYIEGQLQTRKWQGQDGQDRYSTEVVLQGFNSQLTMLDSRGAGAGAGAAAGAGLQESDQAEYGASGNGTAPKRGVAKGGFDKAVDDEIPF